MNASIVIPGERVSSRSLATEEGIFRLPDAAGAERQSIVMSPARVFRPYTLLVWGAKADTTFRSIIIDGDEQLRSKVPGCLFEAEIPFEEFETLLLRRPDQHSALEEESLDEVGHFFRFDMPTVEVGGRIEIEVEGGYDQAVFIGRLVRVDAFRVIDGGKTGRAS